MAQNILAKSFKALHKPGSPIILANIYDVPSAVVVASLQTAKAIATASYAIAASAGVEDDDLTRELNLKAAKDIAKAVKKFGKPLSVDFQDGYGDEIVDATMELLQAGVVGINLEDYNKTTKKMYDKSDGVERIKKVLDTARLFGIDDFVVNARCDTLVHGGSLGEVIDRGQAYLAAGASTVFVWGGSARGGLRRDETVELVKAFDGRLNVWMKLSGGLNAKQLAEIGVARISVGPALQLSAMAKLKQDAEDILRV
jgi:2-methylisocitrate lyase-like PEP mutase family enzyme